MEASQDETHKNKLTVLFSVFPAFDLKLHSPTSRAGCLTPSHFLYCSDASSRVKVWLTSRCFGIGSGRKSQWSALLI